VYDKHMLNLLVPGDSMNQSCFQD